MTLRFVIGLAALCGAALIGCSDARAPVSTAHSQAVPARASAVARGRIEVPGGLLELFSGSEGTVRSLAVAEGEAVRKGQLLLTLANPQTQQDLATARAEWVLAQARQQAQSQRVPAAQSLLNRLGEAARAGASDAQHTDAALQALREAQSAVTVSAAEVGVSQQRLAAAQSQVDRLQVVAPEDGTVVSLQVQPGSRATIGRALLSLLPTRPLVVRAELNEHFVSMVHAGMQVSVQPDGGGLDGASSLKGRVTRMSMLYGPSRLDEDAASHASQRVVECWIALDATPGLRPGQYVRVAFHD